MIPENEKKKKKSKTDDIAAFCGEFSDVDMLQVWNCVNKTHRKQQQLVDAASGPNKVKFSSLCAR